MKMFEVSLFNGKKKEKKPKDAFVLPEDLKEKIEESDPARQIGGKKLTKKTENHTLACERSDICDKITKKCNICPSLKVEKGGKYPRVEENIDPTK